MYISDGSRLGNIIASLVKEQDFASYNNVDFDAATEWFLNTDNHPPHLPADYDEYMKVRAVQFVLDDLLLVLTLFLIHSSFLILNITSRNVSFSL